MNTHRPNQDQNIIQVNKPVHYQTDKLGLVRDVKTLGAIANPNAKSSHW